MSPEQASKDLADFCVDVWESGDGCPMSWIKVMELFKKDVLKKKNLMLWLTKLRRRKS
jgi:hypothetical protein